MFTNALNDCDGDDEDCDGWLSKCPIVQTDSVEQVDDDIGLAEDVGHCGNYSIVNSANDCCYCYIDVEKPNLGYLLDTAIRSLDIRNNHDRQHRQHMRLQENLHGIKKKVSRN